MAMMQLIELGTAVSLQLAEIRICPPEVQCWVGTEMQRMIQRFSVTEMGPENGVPYGCLMPPGLTLQPPMQSHCTALYQSMIANAREG